LLFAFCSLLFASRKVSIPPQTSGRSEKQKAKSKRQKAIFDATRLTRFSCSLLFAFCSLLFAVQPIQVFLKSKRQKAKGNF